MNLRNLNPTGYHVGKGRRWNDEVNGAATRWMERGRCARRGVDPNAWFPETRGALTGPTCKEDETRNDQVARHLCEDCPVMVQCLVFALENKLEYGVYGGRSQTWRHRNGARWLRTYREAQA